MSKLLFDEAPIVIDKTLAKAIGLNETIVIQQIHYWLETNKKKGQNFIDGRYWTYNSIGEWHEEFFYFWSYDTVKRTFLKLEKNGLLIVANYNKDKRDRTKWYSIDYKKLEQLVKENQQCNGAKCTNPNGKDAPMEECTSHQPLPEISSDISTEINNNNNTAAVAGDDLREKIQELKEYCKSQALGPPIASILEDEPYIACLIREAYSDLSKVKNALYASRQFLQNNKVVNLKGLVKAALKQNITPSPEAEPCRLKNNQKFKDLCI